MNLILLLLPLASQAQQETTDPFIFRMAQIEGAVSSCVIIHEKGAFHLERKYARELQVFEGTLSSDRLHALNLLLNSNGFRQLLPAAVATDFRPSGLDELILSSPDQDRWMSLRFLSGTGDDRNQLLLNRFIAWQKSVLKSPHRRVREESGANTCLPAAQIELKVRPK